jgi:hypothetical protein
MAYTAPGTAVAGDVLTAAFWNSNVRDNITELAGAPFARNILYNGAMQISQRGTSTASITTAGYYTADRWNVAIGTLGTWTQSVTADAPTGRGFVNSLKMLCTTADASPAAGDYMLFKQILEGYDVQRIAKGTSSASPLILSFWVKANVTGTYIIEIADNTNNRRIAASYSINASATWEYKTVVIAADTTGTLANDANAALEVVWWLGAGSTFSSGTLQTTWGTTVNANRAVGQTNLASATNNYWQVTGVQLETGSVATGFEFLPITDDLRRCQRYYQMMVAGTAFGPIGSGLVNSTNLCAIYIPMPVQMRANPTVGSFANLRVFDASNAPSVSAIAVTQTSKSVITLDVTLSASTLTAGRCGLLQGNNNAAGYVDFSAEL